MIEFTRKERKACRVLSHLKHDGNEFIVCRFNDLLLNYVQYVMRIDVAKLFEKVSKWIDAGQPA